MDAERVPINGVESESMLKSAGWASTFNHRTARFYKVFDEPPPSLIPAVALQGGRPGGIENPLVIASLIAGLAGVTIIIIIILSIWVLKKASRDRQPLVNNSGRQNGGSRSCKSRDIEQGEPEVESDYLQDDDDEISTQSSMSLHLEDDFHQEEEKPAFIILPSGSRETEV